MKTLTIAAGIGMAALLAGGVALWSGDADPAQARQASSDTSSADALRIKYAPTPRPRWAGRTQREATYSES